MHVKNMKEKAEVLEKRLDQIRSSIRTTDQKINFVSGLVTAMLGFLAMFVSKEMYWTTFLLMATIISATLYIICLIFLLFASFPRTLELGKSIIFFGSISSLTLSEYKHEVIKYSESEYLDDLLNQCYINAKIANRKFKLIKISMLLFFLGIIPWVITIFLINSQL